MSEALEVRTVKLSDGNEIPQVGLGLWQIKEEAEFRETFEAAIGAGYTHFDTAQEKSYGNEHLLGKCIEEADVARDGLFITTKIWVKNYQRHTKDSLDASLEKLRTDYVDLALLHFPIPVAGHRAWSALEELQESGKARSIGVSNFSVYHLERLKKKTGVVPSVNQVEMHVFQQQPEIRGYCEENGIAVEAYSPLAHGKFMKDSKTIDYLANIYHKTYGQIMLRWCVQQGAVVLPKSTSPEHLAENIGVFDFKLEEADMAMLAVINRSQYTNHPSALRTLERSASVAHSVSKFRERVTPSKSKHKPVAV